MAAVINSFFSAWENLKKKTFMGRIPSLHLPNFCSFTVIMLWSLLKRLRYRKNRLKRQVNILSMIEYPTQPFLQRYFPFFHDRCCRATYKILLRVSIFLRESFNSRNLINCNRVFIKYYVFPLPVLLQRWCSTCLVCVQTLTRRENRERPEFGIF